MNASARTLLALSRQECTFWSYASAVRMDDTVPLRMDASFDPRPRMLSTAATNDDRNLIRTVAQSRTSSEMLLAFFTSRIEGQHTCHSVVVYVGDDRLRK